MRKSFHLVETCLVWAFLVGSASSETLMVGMGDSVGEGVQAADANFLTQPGSYLNWVASKLGVPFPLPVIRSSPFVMVGDTTQRARIFPWVSGANLAVSGADVNSILNDRANASTVAEIDSETDLVLFPRQGSQIEIVESLNPRLVICWIGNNNVLSAITHFDKLNATQMTSLATFQTRFVELATRLEALDSTIFFINIPDVTSIAYLLDESDLERLVGRDFALPAGEFTTLPAALLLRLGLADETLLLDPDYVLDASEVDTINTRIAEFNRVIAQIGASTGAHVLDANQQFRDFADNPPIELGVPLTRRFLGGLFSLDGVHPSNIGHALIADRIIEAINALGHHFPRLSPLELAWVSLKEPAWDKDHDGRVVGRPFAGLLETVALFLGLTGDLDDFNANVSPAPPAAPLPDVGQVDSARREEAIQMLKKLWRAKP
jgi:lysophospholipase L1-like esterase